MKKKVLVLEGGGAFGVIISYFLSAAYKEGGSWIDKIDCLSGCSIGGILALSYAAGHTPEEIYSVFKNRMAECFTKRWIAKINPLANPTYDNEALDNVLKDIFQKLAIKNIKEMYPKLDVFIPALNVTKNTYKVFDNITGRDDAVTLFDIAGYTSCAPSYYSGRDFNGDCMVDGGLIEVAPLITTVTGLAGKRDVKFADMDVLMLGCGNKQDEVTLSTKAYNDLGLLGIATKLLVPYTTEGNNMSTLYWGKHMGFNSFTYFNPVPVWGGMDDMDEVNKALDRCPSFKDEFLAVWKEFIKGV